MSGGAIVPKTFVGGIANAYGNTISPDWFRTLGIPLVAGRDFTEQDRKGTPAVAIVNQALARAFLNGASPLGRTLTLWLPRDTPLEIVGVVGDSVYGSLREAVPPTVYTPFARIDGPPLMLANVSLSIRASGAPSLLANSVTSALQTVDPRLALTFRPLADQVNASLVQERLVAMLSGFFGGLALLLAGLGLYGVTSYSVARRRAELGIRMALGAAPRAVVRLVLSRVAMLVGTGVVAGAVFSLWASQFVAALLYGLQPRDPATLVGAALTLAAVAGLAAWLPAWHASRIDPAVVLRDQ
jgi:predicted permease